MSCENTQWIKLEERLTVILRPYPDPRVSTPTSIYITDTDAVVLSVLVRSKEQVDWHDDRPGGCEIAQKVLAWDGFKQFAARFPPVVAKYAARCNVGGLWFRWYLRAVSPAANPTSPPICIEIRTDPEALVALAYLQRTPERPEWHFRGKPVDGDRVIALGVLASDEFHEFVEDLPPLS